MALINPYNNRGILPVESDMFLGREREMRRIEDMLANDRPQCVSIVGERRIGKSSLAYRVFHKLKQAAAALPVYLDCDEIPDECITKDQFFQWLNRKFLETLEDRPEIIDVDKKGGNLFNSYSSFEGFFDIISRKKINSIIFFDEFEHLPKKKFADDSFFSNFRAAANNPENRLALVTISRRVLKELAHKSIISSNFWNIFDSQCLGLLDKDSIERLRNKGFEKTGFSLNKAEKQKIHYYAGDFPFFNQVACGFILGAKMNEEKIEWDRLEVELHSYYEQLWEDRSEQEQELLTDLEQTKPESGFSLREMEERGLLVKKNESYIHFSSFFARFIDLELTTLMKKYLDEVNQDPENIQALRNLKKAYEGLRKESKVHEIEEKLKLLTEQREFADNLGKTITLRQMEFGGLHFFDDFTWRFQPRINVLLGRNGYGKTYLMRFLAALLQKNTGLSPGFFKNSSSHSFVRVTAARDGKWETILHNRAMFMESFGKVPLLAIPDMRFVDKSKISFGIPDEEKTDLKHDGAYHFLYNKSPETIIRNFLYQLCLTYLENGKCFESPVFELIHGIVGELTGSQFKFHRIERAGITAFKIDVITEGNPEPVPLQHASQGTLSILAIFGMIYAYLKELFPGTAENEVVNQPALVFIDELDAHLHPAWQQKIVRLLRENFPHVQFFVTAHSPLVVAGCREGEVAVLRKGGKGFTVHVFKHDFIGWEAGELFGKVFQLKEKDEAYLKYVALSPFKEEIEEKITNLEKQQQTKSLSPGEEKELDLLYDEMYYMERAVAKYREKRKYNNLSIENRKLKNKIRQLENTDKKQETGHKQKEQ
jgi:ABC-type multidrug transport system ATPase subunit